MPEGTAMSMPSCMRPQRIPNPEVSGPCTGQIIPELDTVLSITRPLFWAAMILAASFADSACRPAASASICRRSPRTCDNRRAVGAHGVQPVAALLQVVGDGAHLGRGRLCTGGGGLQLVVGGLQAVAHLPHAVGRVAGVVHQVLVLLGDALQQALGLDQVR
ncbi:MAG: hypothetical protein U0Y82_07795 [Thermoleophilia bacterium]